MKKETKRNTYKDNLKELVVLKIEKMSEEQIKYVLGFISVIESQENPKETVFYFD